MVKQIEKGLCNEKILNDAQTAHGSQHSLDFGHDWPANDHLCFTHFLD
jgi:hypothetical protein